MCYGIRAMQAEPGREDASQPSSGMDRLRPRLLGAVAAVLVAGFAAAALLTPSPQPSTTVEKLPAATVPTVGAIEQTTPGLDDGVPTALNEMKRSTGECHHGL